MKIEFIIPLTRGLIVSEANTSEHWSKKSARHKIQRMLLKCYLTRSASEEFDELLKLPSKWLITLTRIAPRMLDEGDNLPMSMKYFKDAIADWFYPGLAAGRADDNKSLKWFFKQEKGKVKEYGLKVEIENV